MRKALKFFAKVFGIIFALVFFAQISFMGIVLFAAHKYDAQRYTDEILADEKFYSTPAKSISATIRDIQSGSEITIPLSNEEYYIGRGKEYLVGKLSSNFTEKIPDSLLCAREDGGSFFLVEAGSRGRAFVFIPKKSINEAVIKQLQNTFFTL